MTSLVQHSYATLYNARNELHTFTDCFLEVIPLLGARLLHKGSLPRDEYKKVLNSAHVVVSTAKHEFLGVAMYGRELNNGSW